MKNLKKKSGISLIVLVTTIIVMIILATVIILSISNSGIIENAKKAKRDTDIATIKELVSISYAEWEMMDKTERKEYDKSFKKYAEEKIKKAKADPEDYVISNDGEVDLCVAMIGTTKYASLEDAVDSVEEDVETTITIINDTYEDVVNEITKNQTIILDLNGNRLYAKEWKKAINVKGKLTIKDSSSDKSGKIIAKADLSKYNKLYDFDEDGFVNDVDLYLVTELYSVSKSNTEIYNKYTKFDTNSDGVIALREIVDTIKNFTGGVAIACESDSELILQDIESDQIIGDDVGIVYQVDYDDWWK